MADHLSGRVAIVTGASRGGGRGIARALGDAGATVYVTGRTDHVHADADSQGLTIDTTADLVNAAGGIGIPVRCDHTVDTDVEALFERVRREQDRLDLLVNNVWGGYENHDETFTWPFWKQDMRRWRGMFDAGLRAHYTASRLAAPIMIGQHRGLIVSTIAYDRGKYLGSVPYDTAKAAIVRMLYGMSLELKEHGVAALSLAPGFMRTEAVLAHFGTDEDHWREVPELADTESPFYVGRAVVALASDPDIMKRSGNVLVVGELAREYGFTDVDGRQPLFRIPDEFLKD